MKVAMVSEHASPLAVLGGVDAGGQNVHVANLARAVARLGASVTVHTRRDDARSPARVAFAPRVDVHHVDAGPARPVPKDELFGHMDRFAEILEDAWRCEPPDVVHSHFWMSGYAAVRAAAALDIPVVHTFHALGVVKRRHQADRDTSPSERLSVEEGLLRSVDWVAATSTDEVFELVRLGGAADRITVIPCGVELDLFHPAGPVMPRRPGVPRVAVVCRLVPRKGVDTVIEAIAGIPEAELVVAGGPDREALCADPEATRLRELADACGVGDRVTFLGRIDRTSVAALMRSADVLAAVPWYEPFGIVPVEAMACGTPVVVSAVGGQIDTVIDGVTGAHVPPRRPDLLAEEIASMLADRRRVAALAEAGVQRAHGLYGWDRVAQLTLDVYRSVGSTTVLREVRS